MADVLPSWAIQKIIQHPNLSERGPRHQVLRRTRQRVAVAVRVASRPSVDFIRMPKVMNPERKLNVCGAAVVAMMVGCFEGVAPEQLSPDSNNLILIKKKRDNPHSDRFI